MEKLKIKEIEIDKLKPAEYNPRQASKDQEINLQNSLKKFGVVEPVIINTNPVRENVIIGGHFRVRELKKQGSKTVPCVLVNLSLEDEKELNIRLNKNTGDWDWDELANNFDNGKLLDWGFEEFELGGFEGENANILEDEAPEIQENFIVKTGDIWEMGEHRLVCGDATKKEDVAKLMGDEKADMVFTDPPYNIDYDFNDNGMVQAGRRKARFGKIKNDRMQYDDFLNFIKDAFLNILSSLKEGGVYYISSSRTSIIVFNSILQELDFHIHTWLIWEKENFNISRLDYHPAHEIITYGWKKGIKHNWYSDRRQSDILKFKRDTNTVHPTQKPILLLSYFIKNSSKKNDVVLDLFGGSGSTLIACEQINRKCKIMELDKRYCDVIIRRWQNLTREKAVLKKTGQSFEQIVEAKGGINA